MSWIEEISEEDATGPLAEAYERVRSRRGKLSNIMRVQSLAPKAMEAHLELYLDLLFAKGKLTRPERELIAVVVSVQNGCEYCTLHHAAALDAYWKDPERVERLKASPFSAELSPRESDLVAYAVELTARPHAVEQKWIDRLRGHGLDDAEILRANMIVAYFNFVNRVVQGLGVEFSREEVEGYRY